MKLSGGEEVCPFLGVVGTENVEIYFDFLIGLFSLSIGLRVVCGGEFHIILEEMHQFSGEGGCELWSSVQD